MTLVACQNNGDIGDFYGTWSVSELTVDGEPDSEFAQDSTFFNFQNNIISVERLLDEYGDLERYVGTWSEVGNSLLLDFTHYDNDHAPGQGIYHAPEWLYLPENSIAELEFIERKSRSMTLRYITDEGKEIVYALKKTW